MSLRVGLIGARGYVGQEMITLVDRHPQLELAYASSREWAGRPVREIASAVNSDVCFEALDPEAVAARHADVVILGLPNGKSAGFVDALFGGTRIEPVIVDLSADYRNAPDWAYGLPELFRDRIEGRKLISNPGCYATAAQLALHPVRGLVDGVAHVFGVSGWSGAGTSPSRKNDPDALLDNLQPYGLVGHGHQAEMARGSRCRVRFMPSVAQFFRGLVVTVSAPVRDDVSVDQLRAAYVQSFADEPLVVFQDDPAEPAAVAHGPYCVLGGLGHDPASRTMVITAALDNLLKGAASQAMQNVNLALGFDERAGILSQSAIAQTVPAGQS